MKFIKNIKEILRLERLHERDINRLIQTNLSTMMLHQKTFSDFKCKHQNQDIVIYASGPSAINYQPIENAVHIGVNRSFQTAKVKLDYIFLQDYSGKTPEYIDELDNYRPGECVKFYGLSREWEEEPNRIIPESHAIKANALRYRIDHIPVDNFEVELAYDITTRPLGCFGSVVFPTLQFALYTYPKRIYLVGCDCSMMGYSYNKNENNFLIPSQIIAGYKKFKIFAKRYYPDVEIISINPVGLKGVFKDIFYE